MSCFYASRKLSFFVERCDPNYHGICFEKGCHGIGLKSLAIDDSPLHRISIFHICCKDGISIDMMIDCENFNPYAKILMVQLQKP